MIQEFYALIEKCFGLTEAQRKRLQPRLKIDTVYQWSDDLHCLVLFPFMVEEFFSVEFNDTEIFPLCSKRATLRMWIDLIEEKTA